MPPSNNRSKVRLCFKFNQKFIVLFNLSLITVKRLLVGIVEIAFLINSTADGCLNAYMQRLSQFYHVPNITIKFSLMK